MTQRSAPRLVPLCLVALGLSAVAANCEQCQEVGPPRRGNLDRAADVVLVEVEDHTFAVVTNPELGHLRLLDLTTERFVDAPNRFFPLSIEVGPDTRRLTTAPGDGGAVYALDTAADTIFIISTADGFTQAPVAITTGRAPGDLAAFRVSDEEVELYVTLPDEGALQILSLVGGESTEVARLPLGADSLPVDVVVDPFGDSIVVADAHRPVVHVIDRAARAFDRVLDVGGPVSGLDVGVVDIGDGEAPVVLALRADAPAVAAVRLFRPGYREDRVAVLGTAEVPSLPLTGYVPDHRESVTVCCRALTAAALEAGEATSAWAAIGAADGNVYYVALAAPTGDGRVVRLIDDDVEGLAAGALSADAWRPVAGDEDRRPTLELRATSDFGDPPHVPMFGNDGQLVLTWEGALPGLRGLRVSSFTGEGGSVATASTQVDLAARGAVLGDVVTFALASPEAGCPAEVTGLLTELERAEGVSTMQVVLGEEDIVCVASGGLPRLTIGVGDGFAVADRDGSFLGRLGFVGRFDTLAVPGALVTIEPSSAGPPLQGGSVLVVPLSQNLDTISLPLPLPPQNNGGGIAAYLPVAIVGGEMQIPDQEREKLISARRMVIATGSASAAGLNVMFACDEAETIPGRCLQFQ